MSPSRRRRRRTRHLVLIGITVVVVVVAARSQLPATFRTRQWLSVGLAYASLGAVLAALGVGPLSALRRRPAPVSVDLRRDLGLTAAVTGGAHVVLSLGNHFFGRVERYFFDGGRVAPQAVRLDGFGVAVWLGVAATVLLAVLTATSNDRALRRLGPRWKRVQRWSVALAALAVVHTALFWVLLDRGVRFAAPTALAVAAVAALRMARSLLGRREGVPRPLVGS